VAYSEALFRHERAVLFNEGGVAQGIHRRVEAERLYCPVNVWASHCRQITQPGQETWVLAGAPLGQHGFVGDVGDGGDLGGCELGSDRGGPVQYHTIERAWASGFGRHRGPWGFPRLNAAYVVSDGFEGLGSVQAVVNDGDCLSLIDDNGPEQGPGLHICYCYLKKKKKKRRGALASFLVRKN